MFVSTATRGAASPAAGTTLVARSRTVPRTSLTVAAPSARYFKYSELCVLYWTALQAPPGNVLVKQIVIRGSCDQCEVGQNGFYQRELTKL